MKLDPMIMLIAIMVLIFVLGWPLEWVPIVLIIIPVLMPLVREMGYNLDLVLHPGGGDAPDRLALPAGGAFRLLFKGGGPQWKLQDIYAGMMQFMGLQMIGMLIILFFPSLATWLPMALRQ